MDPPSVSSGGIWAGHSLSPPAEDSGTQCGVSEVTALRAESGELGHPG